MADMRVEDSGFKNLHQKVGALASAAESLVARLEVELTSLKRKDDVTRLNVLRSTALQQVERVTGEEMAARSSYNRARTEISLFRLATGLVMMTSENRTMRAISRELLIGPSGREAYYGTILVRIGSGGVPEDVDVVCISHLARESNREEFAVMNELQKNREGRSKTRKQVIKLAQSYETAAEKENEKQNIEKPDK